MHNESEMTFRSYILDVCYISATIALRRNSQGQTITQISQSCPRQRLGHAASEYCSSLPPDKVFLLSSYGLLLLLFLFPSAAESESLRHDFAFPEDSKTRAAGGGEEELQKTLLVAAKIKK